MTLSKRCFAEFLGTFWLVFGGCGSAVLAAAFPNLGIGFAGVALAFGLTLLTMAFTIGPISGCHINPAVSVGLVVGRRFPVSELLPYVVAQVLGAIVGSATLYVIARGKEGFSLSGGFASNGYGVHSPDGYSLVACFVAEVVLTMFFLLVIFGLHRRPCSQGICSYRHRPVSYPHPLDFHSRHKHFRKPGAQYGTCSLRRRVGGSAAMAVLDRPHHRRYFGWCCLLPALRGGSAEDSSRRRESG